MWRRLLVLTGIAALVAWFLRRERAESVPATGIDPSEELRRRLDAARVREEGAREPGPGDDDTPDVDARRRDVHDRARAAIDEMNGSAE
jgi:hypothetical protein